MRWISQRYQTIKEISGHPLNQNDFVGSLARYLRWNLGRRLLDIDFIMPLVDDVRIILSNEENYATLAYTEQLWDFSEMLFLLHLLREDDLFLDVGSNAGAYTLLASSGADASSMAFEPVPATFNKLVRNLRLNDVQDKVDARNFGVADKVGNIDFTTDLGGLNHVARTGIDTVTQSVPVVTLDLVLEGRVPRAMKLDVEGYELAVLNGAPKVLAESGLQAIIVELNRSGERYGFRDDDVHKTLLSAGFLPFSYDPLQRSLRELNTYNNNGNSFNTIYCRKNDFLEKRLSSARRYAVRGLEF